MGFKDFLQVLLQYFLKGLLFTVPAAATIYVIVNVFMIIDGFLDDYLSVYLPFPIPGLGLVTLVFVITVFGFLASTIIAQPISFYANRLMERAPLIKTLYSAVKDLVSAFVGTKKRFDQPVLVKLVKASDTEKLGFLTREDLEDLGIPNGKVAVYLPHSYAFSGNLYIVPKENVTPINASAADVMKFIVSGGVSDIE